MVSKEIGIELKLKYAHIFGKVGTEVFLGCSRNFDDNIYEDLEQYNDFAGVLTVTNIENTK